MSRFIIRDETHGNQSLPDIPIYNNYVAIMRNKDTTEPEWEKKINWPRVTAAFNKLSDQHFEIAYVIILHHYMITTRNASNFLPYGAKITDGGTVRGTIRFIGDNFPPELQKILYLFVQSVVEGEEL